MRATRDRSGSSGSILSIGSTGSILSIGSAGSILSIGSAGSVLSVGSVASAASLFSGDWISSTCTACASGAGSLSGAAGCGGAINKKPTPKKTPTVAAATALRGTRWSRDAKSRLVTALSVESPNRPSSSCGRALYAVFANANVAPSCLQPSSFVEQSCSIREPLRGVVSSSIRLARPRAAAHVAAPTHGHRSAPPMRSGSSR